MKQIKAVGIDPGIVETGIAIFQAGELTDYTTIKPPAKEKLSVRLNILGEGVKEFLAYNKVNINWRGVVEVADGFSYGRTQRAGKSLNQRQLHKLQMATGAIIRACGEQGLMVDNYTPEEWKGNTKKEITLYNVNAEHGLKLTMKQNHVADAISLCEWYLRLLKRGGMIEG